MITEHLIETKKQINKLADEILLNPDDVESDERMFNVVHGKLSNLVIQDHLRDLANERLENFKTFVSDESEIAKYREQLVTFLLNTIRERM